MRVGAAFRAATIGGMASTSTPTTAAVQTVDVLPLTPERFGDLAALFAEGGDPKWCWCVYFRFRGRDWSNSTAGQNRAALEDLTATGRPPGLVAYQEGRAVGWVSLGPREEYERLAWSKVLAPVDDTPVWSIVCFVVSRRARGRGLAAALLDAAVGVCARGGRDDPGGVSGRRRRRPDPRGERLSRDPQRCSRRPGSRSSSGASTTPPARSGRSSGDRSIRASGHRRAGLLAHARPGARPPTSSVARPTSSSDEG